MLKFLTAIFVLGFAGSGFAETLSCRANVALNRVYQVSLDDQTGETNIENDAGTTLSGIASRYVSGRTGNTTWFLPAGFTSGVEIQKESGGAGRIALCLAANECYQCR